jgi:hypothetical protein
VFTDTREERLARRIADLYAAARPSCTSTDGVPLPRLAAQAAMSESEALAELGG